MRACFADNANLPLTCSIDIREPWNCQRAMQGGKRNDCPYWLPKRAFELAFDILGETVSTMPDCSGELCIYCDTGEDHPTIKDRIVDILLGDAKKMPNVGNGEKNRR